METLQTDSEPINFVNNNNSNETLTESSQNSTNSNKSEEEEEEEEEMDTSPFHRRTYASQSSYSHWAQPWGSKLSNFKSLDEPDDDDDEASPSNWLDRPSNIGSMWSFNRDEEAKKLGAGLANLGNTCFLNAVLQSFMHTVPLLQGLKSSDHATPCDSYLKGFCTICALRELSDASLVSETGVVSPWKFVNNLNYFSSTFHRFQQEDAHEFLQCFLDKLERCDDSRPKDCTSLEIDNIVKQAFGGRLVSKLRCCNCGHCSDTYETLIDLSLEIEDVDSLATALESFTKVEKIEDSEIKFTCEQCKEQVTIEKQLVLDKTPSVAALHLKRFKTDGSLVEKIDKYVSFPLDLDLHSYADNNQINNEEMKYDLFAVIVHTGFSYCSGHYYSFIRSAPNEWYKFDDSKVFRVREDFVLSQEAYILLYAKRGTPWFSEFIKEQKPFIDPSILSTSPKSVLDNADPVSVTSPRMPDTMASCVKESSDAADKSSPSSPNKVQDSERKERAWIMSIPESHGANSILDSKSHELDKVFLPSVLKENCNNLDHGATRTVYITPKTPPRSPSPEIYREDPPENNYHIPRAHLRSADQVSCKKQRQKGLEQDMVKKQACSLINKTSHGSRRQQLLAAVQRSQSEGSVNKKRRRMEVSPTRDDSNSTSRRFGNMFRTAVAGLR